MKIISLNIWGGIVFGPLLTFLRRQSADTDIFCFQEVLFGSAPGLTSVHQARLNIFEEIKQALPEFTSYKLESPSQYFQDNPLNGVKIGQTIFQKSP